MHRPSAPKLQPREQVVPSARPREVYLEEVKEEERKKQAKHKGYSSTVMTRGGVGEARTQKAKVLGE